MDDDHVQDQDQMAIAQLSSGVPDAFVTVVRMASGLGGPAGTLIAEIFARGVLRQRDEALREVLTRVCDRLNRLEKAEQRRRLEDPAYIGLLRASLQSAVQASSAERIAHIAELAARGMTSEERSAEDTRLLLGKLEALSDSEVILLISVSKHPDEADYAEFYGNHQALLAPPTAELGIPQAEIDRSALRGEYQSNLLRLGLLIDGHAPPEVSPLGSLLLRFIGELS